MKELLESVIWLLLPVVPALAGVALARKRIRERQSYIVLAPPPVKVTPTKHGLAYQKIPAAVARAVCSLGLLFCIVCVVEGLRIIIDGVSHYDHPDVGLLYAMEVLVLSAGGFGYLLLLIIQNPTGKTNEPLNESH